MRAFPIALLLLACACIAPSVLPSEERDASTQTTPRAWRPAQAADLPGTYVSQELSGRLATVLRLLVYDFHTTGTYTGAALLDDAPPRFEVLSGTWSFDPPLLVLDDAPPAKLEVAEDGALRLSGPQGSVVLGREERR